MGNSTSIKHKYSSEEINKLTRETGFTLGQLDNLHHRFEKLDINKNGYLEREDLLLLPELNVNPLSDRIIHAFFSENLTVKESQKLRFQVIHKNVCIVIYIYIAGFCSCPCSLHANIKGIQKSSEQQKRKAPLFLQDVWPWWRWSNFKGDTIKYVGPIIIFNQEWAGGSSNNDGWWPRQEGNQQDGRKIHWRNWQIWG